MTQGIFFRIVIFLFQIITLSNCSSFESELFEKIKNGQINAIENGIDSFNLSTITDFEWDSVLLIRGNESVPIEPEEVEAILNLSNVEFKAKSLPTDIDRFYFLTKEKKLIIRQTKSGITKHKPGYIIHNCPIDSLNERRWLSKNECQFTLKSNTHTPGQGMVILIPECINEINNDSTGTVILH